MTYLNLLKALRDLLGTAVTIQFAATADSRSNRLSSDHLAYRTICVKVYPSHTLKRAQKYRCLKY